VEEAPIQQAVEVAEVKIDSPKKKVEKTITPA
jgi:hypothetical protein